MFVTESPYGTWRSPLSAASVAAQGLRLGGLTVSGADIHWVEGRPAEGGRNVLMRRRSDGAIEELTPPGLNVRTRVHEYGGGAYVADQGVVCFSNFEDQRIYRASASGAVPITPEGRWCYADAVIDRARQRLICVREDHTRPEVEPISTLVGVGLGGAHDAGRVLASGHDFYSTPRLSPDGARLAWLAWRHPQMPWDGTELWVADLAASGCLERAVHVAGGPEESVYQPGWSPDGSLYFVSDRDGWWRLYRRAYQPDASSGRSASREATAARGLGPVEPVVRNAPDRAEFGRPQWVFGTATWAFAGSSTMVVSYTTAGRWRLAIVDLATRMLRDLAVSLEPHEWLAATPTHAILVAGFATAADAVVRVELRSGAVETVREASSVRVHPDDISLAESLELPRADGRSVHAFYYASRNRACVAPPGERPPLIAISHGGPTSAARATLDPRIQFWTTRGFAVVDVNYAGSSGYGRAYRRSLNGRWGLSDVSDMVDTVQGLAAAGRVDRGRVVIRGGSAGGYTTLAALTFCPDVFKAGASYYGVSDLEVLARDTHKFESRYLDTLVGPYPAARATYVARSPIHFVDQLSCPLIIFQGLEDRVVPPDQSERMASAVRANGFPLAYLAFEGEQHGFRKSETIVRCLEAELYFYGTVFGFTPADPIAPVRIDNQR